MKTVQFLTANGNVSVKARSEIKAQVVSMLQNRVGKDLVMTDKGLAMEVATDISGAPIYMVIDPVITMSLEVKAKTPKSKSKVEVVVPALFE
jgi:hypothetical protein